jgi:hypothetical protein
MNGKRKKGVKKTVLKKKAYLTKRLLLSASQKAFKKASIRAMKKMGYTIIVKDGYLQRVNADGTNIKLKKIKPVKRPSKIILD